MATTPEASRRGLAALVVLGVVVRAWQASRLGTPPEPAGLALPWDGPPLLEVVTALLFGVQTGVALLGGVAALVGVAVLAHRGLSPRGALVATGVAALAPPMVFGGAWWAPANLAIPLVLAASWRLIRVLDEGGAPWGLFGVGVALGAADWIGFAPLAAWTIWLAAFRPAWVGRAAGRRALAAVGGATVVTLGLWTLMVTTGTDPHRLFADGLPEGLDALRMHVDSIAALVVGRTPFLPLPVRVGMAAVVVGLVWRGARAARGTAWGGVLAVGSAGGFVLALWMHPMVPMAQEKALWAMAPLAVLLGVCGVMGAGEAARQGAGKTGKPENRKTERTSSGFSVLGFSGSKSPDGEA